MNEIITHEASGKMEAIKSFQAMVKSQLNEGEDYGRVPGVPKPFLFKSGAEKILSILGITYEIPEYIEVFKEIEIAGTTIPYYEVQCRVIAKANGEIVGFGIGSCNTLEKKYCKDKNGNFILDPVHYYSLKNTILKMAEKKAKVDLALHIGSLSNIFTQDEDNVEVEEQEPAKPSSKQIDYFIKLLEKNKENKEIIQKACELAKAKLVNNQLQIEGNMKDISSAIEFLKGA